MDKHCVSLEIAKQLKESGWKKETEFWYCEGSNYHENTKSWTAYIDIFSRKELSKNYVDFKVLYPAPLATEILEELPREVSIKQYPENDSVRYQVGHNVDKMALQTFSYSNNLCDALGEIWLYLRKEN